MATTKQLIESAMRTIGVLAAGEQAQPSELQDALMYAKQMLDSWSNESLLVPAYTSESFTLEAERSYTIGPGGDFDTVRPIGIRYMRIRDAGSIDHTVALTSLTQWASEPIKDTAEYVPDYAYYADAYPLGRIEFSSITTAGHTMFIESTKPIIELPELTGEVTYPPGYDRAIRLGLAMELAPEYGKQVDAVLAQQLRTALLTLKRTNGATRVPTLRVDAGITDRGGYDVMTGTEV